MKDLPCNHPYKRFFKHAALLLAAVVCTLVSPAQDSIAVQKKKPLRVRVECEDAHFSGRLKKDLRHVTDSANLKLRIAGLQSRFCQQGFAEFGFDSLSLKADSLIARIHIGPKYFLRSLQTKDLPESAVRQYDVDRFLRKPRPFCREETERMLMKVIGGFQDKGYPFARFDSLDLSYEKENDSIWVDAGWHFEPGAFIRIDSIIIRNKVRESNRFIYSLIGINPGDAFNQSLIDEIPRRLENTPYFRDAKRAAVTFSEKNAKLILDFQPRKAGRFDLLLGILPPLKEEPKKIRFTGLVDLLLVSPVFSAGEMIKLRYDKLVGSSQKLLLNYQHPRIAGLPLNGEFELNILKQDTIFLSRYIRVAAGYQLNPRLSVKVWYRNRSTSLLSTLAYQADTTRKPPVLDGRDNLYGLGFTFDNLDYRFNPTHGFYIRLNAGSGLKKVRKNPKLTDSQYSGVTFSVPRQETEAEIHWYQKTFKRQVVHLANRTSWLRQSQYFLNDLFQVGGAQSLRGFNENQFYASFYTLFTAEYRYILERNSWLFAFSDFGYLETPNVSPFVTWPVGIGAGMAYETKAGIVSITYAVGRTGESPFQPSRGRIHFGLVNQF